MHVLKKSTSKNVSMVFWAQIMKPSSFFAFFILHPIDEILNFTPHYKIVLGSLFLDASLKFKLLICLLLELKIFWIIFDDMSK